MAFWNYKLVNGRKYVFVYRRVNGKQVQLKPRSLYSHLDGAPEHNINAWVGEWTERNEGRAPDALLPPDPQMLGYLQKWSEHLGRVRHRTNGTRKKYVSLIRRYALPYFQGLDCGDPQRWPGVSIRLYDHLTQKGCSQSLIAEINNALRGFYSWLQDEGYVAYDGDLRLRNSPRVIKRTPLQFALKPDVVLKFAKQVESREVRFLALAGYFFSLRSQEVFALRPMDFVAGKEAEGLDCGIAMKEAGLFSRLAVEIIRQQTPERQDGEVVFGDPKAYSMGWVSCFDKEAAKMLVELLNGVSRVDAKVLSDDNRAIYRLWQAATKDTKLQAIDLKDLRRASLYYLGHHSDLTPIQLMKHARHRELETTQLYLRRPEEKLARNRGRKLSLGA